MVCNRDFLGSLYEIGLGLKNHILELHAYKESARAR